MNDRIIKVKGIGTVSAKPDLIIITMELDTAEFDYQTIRCQECIRKSSSSCTGCKPFLGSDKEY